MLCVSVVPQNRGNSGPAETFGFPYVLERTKNARKHHAYQSLLYLYIGVPFGKNNTTVPSIGSISSDVNTTLRCEEGLVYIFINSLFLFIIYIRFL